jgi:hypothetical protein
MFSIAIGMLISAGLVWNSSSATFTATTANPNTNTWSAGSLSLADDDTGTTMFNTPNLKPGDTGTRCLRVTYSGSVASAIKLYTTAASYTGTLGTYIDLTVHEGAAGTYADPTCSNWTTGTQIYTGTMANFNTTHTNYANGVSAWTPTTNADFKVYKFAYTLQTAAPNASQGTAAGIGFTWEAQNRAGAVNVALSRTATTSTSCNGGEGPEKAFTASLSDKWCSTNASKWLQVDLGATRSIQSFTLKHAAAGGETSDYNTRDYDIDVSANGTDWTNIVQARGVNAATTSHNVATSGRYVKLTVIDGEQIAGTTARIYEFEVYDD